MNALVIPTSSRPWRALVVTSLCVALFASFAPFARLAPAAADVSFDQRMFELVNAARAANGVAPLQWSATLGTVAENGNYTGCGSTIHGRAHDMGERNYFSHTILGCRQNVGNMVVAAGLSASAMGENISWASGQGTDPLVAAQALHNGLMSSASHRANILNANFTHVGIGSWRTAPGQNWTGNGSPQPNVWVIAQVFAKLAVTTAPVLSVTPASLTFTSLLDLVTLPQTLTVKNTGTSRMSITGTLVNGTNAADFGLGVNTCLLATVDPGGSCTIALVFLPKAIGTRNATLSIMGDAPGSVPLTGTATANTAVPGIPANVVATGGGQLGVTWAPVSGTVDSYGVWVFDAAGYTNRYVSVCGTCTSATVTGLPSGKGYYVGVAAHNAAGWGTVAYSAWVTVAVVPGAPAGISVSSRSGQMTTSWTPPANAAAAGVDSYMVVVYDVNGAYTGRYATCIAPCTGATVTGLTTGAWYLAVVYAHNANGWGDAGLSQWIAIGAPSAPQNLRTTAGNGQVASTWSTPASDAGSPIDTYMVVAYDANGYTGRYATCAAACTGAVVTGLTNGRSYTMVAYAHNAVGWGAAAISAPTTPVG